MNTSHSLESGYLLEGLFFPVQQIAPSNSPASDDQDNIGWGWDWRWNDAEHFEVGLMLAIPATVSRPENIEVAATAIFRVVGSEHSVPISAFAHMHAAAMLFPYLRQVVDELTSRSPHGRILLPPTNVVALMANFDPDEATGAKRSRPNASSAGK